MSALVAHDGAAHMSDGSILMFISMIAFALFLLAFAWALLRPSKPPGPTSADIATERFAQGKIDADEFERAVRDIKTHRT